MNIQKKLIVIAGPTAVGKTSVAIKLAQHYDCPILSADSRQIYKEMNIGTAKPTKKELASAPHYFINHISIQDHYNAGMYEREAIQLLDKIYETNDYAIICGGTGLYINAVLYGLDEFPKTDPNIDQYYDNMDLVELQKEIAQKDPEYGKQVDLNNKRRLSRALSIIEASGKTYSSLRTSEKKQRIFEPELYFIKKDRTILYENINNRVELMLEAGLEEEAKTLYSYKGLKALATVGYQEFFDYFDHEISKEKAIELIKRNSRRYAKRQMTWYRNKPEWKWITAEELLLEKS